MTARPRYGGMRLPLAIGAVVDGYPSTFQTPLSGQISPVRARVPIGERNAVAIWWPFLSKVFERRKAGATRNRPGDYRTDMVRAIDRMAHLLPSGWRRAALQGKKCATLVEMERRPVIDRPPFFLRIEGDAGATCGPVEKSGDPLL